MRPLARPYLQHGTRHLKHGSDPIPGIGDLPVATLRTTAAATIVADNADHYVSLEDGVSGSFQTSDDTVFANNSTTLFTGSPVFGVEVLQPGLYQYQWNSSKQSGGTVGAGITVYWSSSGGATLSSLQQGRTATLVGDAWDTASNTHISWTEYQAFGDADVPGVAAPYARVASGSNVTLNIDLIVIRVTSFDLDAI